MILATLCLLALIAAYVYLNLWLRVVRFALYVPTLSGYLPLIGHGHHLMRDSRYLFKYILDLSSELICRGGILKIWLGPVPLFIVTDYKDAQTVLNSGVRKNYMYNFGTTWLGEGLITAPPQKWKVHRKLLNPVFSQTASLGYLSTFNAQSRRLVEHLSLKVSSGDFDHWPPLANVALETLCQSAFGLPAEDENISNDEYRSAVENMLNVVMTRFKNIFMHFDFIYNLTKTKREEEKLAKILHKMSSDVLERNKVNSKNHGEPQQKQSDHSKYFVDILLRHAAEGSMSQQDVQAEMDTMIIAGHETTTSALMYTLVLLGAYPEVQDRVYKELIDIFGDSDRDVTKEDLFKMAYLEAVIKENLRLIPVIPIVIRELESDVKLNNYTLAAGSNVIINIWGLNRNTSWGEDANDFKPERWLDEASLPQNPSFASFSIGKRGCIGKSYAMVSMKTTLAHLLRKYRINSTEKSLEFKLDIILRPVSKLQISIEPR